MIICIYLKIYFYHNILDGIILYLYSRTSYIIFFIFIRNVYYIPPPSSRIFTFFYVYAAAAY